MPHVDAHLAFTRPADVTLDDPTRGLKRARTLDDAAMDDPQTYDQRLCQIHDCTDLHPDLRDHGFAHADLSHLGALQATFARVRAAGRLTDKDAAEIRRRLLGRSLTLSSGARMRLLFVARDGFFMRRAGPGGLRLHDQAHERGLNGHDAARAVHADQDVEGTPLRQILRGAAPWLFHHDSPDRHNRRSAIHLVNLWVPLQQVTRPLALMDRRTLDRRAHQLRHGLPTDTFLKRRPDMRVNDIWTFLHDDRQRWYFTAAIDSNTAYVFETLGTPHGSFTLPGESLARSLYLQLLTTRAAVQAHDEPAARAALAADHPLTDAATEPLRRAIAAMHATLSDARAHTESLCRGDATEWVSRATLTTDAVIRQSLEMRAIALVTRP